MLHYIKILKMYIQAIGHLWVSYIIYILIGQNFSVQMPSSERMYLMKWLYKTILTICRTHMMWEDDFIKPYHKIIS